VNRVLILCVLLMAIVSSIGCATKSYVRKQVTPLLNRVNDLDQRTAENTKDIKDVDARAQQGIQAANSSTEQLSQKTTEAGNQAQQAKDLASSCDTKVASLTNTVSNLDNYHVVAQTLVEFGFDHTGLSNEAQQELDQIGSQLNGSKGYIVVVQGGTDNSGNKEYNYELSQKRAEEVVRYLSSKYNVPPYKVYAIGVGDEKPVAPNNTADGRQKNRRAEVQLMSNTGTRPSSQSEPDDETNEIGRVAIPKQ